MGFCQSLEMCPKVGQSGFLDAKVGETPDKTHFLSTLNPCRDIDTNFKPTLGGGGNCLLKRALRQSRPSISFGVKTAPSVILRCCCS